jgi:NADH-quinone oxidoreductase subunit G
MDVDLFTQTPATSAGDFAKLGAAASVKFGYVDVPAGPAPAPAAGQAVLATWRQLIDKGSLQVDEPHLAGTARPVVARLSAATANGFPTVKVSTDRGSITLPVEVSDLPDGVVWLPANSAGSQVRASLGAGHGSLVAISGGEL